MFRDLPVFATLAVFIVAIATAVPLSPLLLTVFSFEELVIRAFKVVF